MHTRIEALPSHQPALPPMKALLRHGPTVLLSLAANALVIGAASGFLYLSSPARLTARVSGNEGTLAAAANANTTSSRTKPRSQPALWSDRYADGTPDFLRLDAVADRESFRCAA